MKGIPGRISVLSTNCILIPVDAVAFSVALNFAQRGKISSRILILVMIGSPSRFATAISSVLFNYPS